MAQVATSEFLLKAIRFNIKTNTGNVEHLNFSVSLTVSLFFSFVMKHKSASHLIKVPLKYKIQSPLFTTIKDKTIDSWNKCIPNVNLVACNWTYNEVSDLMYNWVAKRPDFKSALRVVKMVLNTQWYQCLWLTMWFHAKNPKKHSKNQNRWFYYVNSAHELWNHQKLPKTDHSIVIFCMVYSGWYMVNPHVQAVQNMCGKGGKGVLGRVRGGQSWPSFLKKKQW